MKKGDKITLTGTVKTVFKDGGCGVQLDGWKYMVYLHPEPLKTKKKPALLKPGQLAEVITEGNAKHGHYFKKGMVVEFAEFEPVEDGSSYLFKNRSGTAQFLNKEDFRLLPAGKAAKKKVKK